MPEARLRVRTSLPLRDVAAIFERTAHEMHGVGSKVGAFARRFSGYGATEFEFFTPRDTPFSVLDQDPPAFSVGVQVPKFGGQGGGVVTLHLYVWDRGDSREAEFYAPHSLTGGISARKAVDRALSAIRTHDRQAEVIA